MVAAKVSVTVVAVIGNGYGNGNGNCSGKDRGSVHPCRYHRDDESGNGKRNSGGYRKGNGNGRGGGNGNATAAETVAAMVLEVVPEMAAVHISKAQ